MCERVQKEHSDDSEINEEAVDPRVQVIFTYLPFQLLQVVLVSVISLVPIIKFAL